MKNPIMLQCLSAPEITTVSKPNKKPAIAAVINHVNTLFRGFIMKIFL
ncbi:hypothetical protein [Polaribacter sp. Q13]|nr:hypothetical protein [Polaribacter sp. Q13]QVY66163.1 hypothetical protein JOP69_02400 [Polaribacter sp. Q13]